MAIKASRGVGYRRVSTSEQVMSGLGLDAQQTAIEIAAARLDLPLVAMFTDAGVSGGLALEYRPALLTAIETLAAGDTLIVAKRDRLGRDVLNVAMIERLVERRGARIVSPDAPDTNDPSATLMRQIIDCFAQYERAIIRARTKAAMQAAKARGQRVGQIPYGSRLASDGRTLLKDPDEQQTLQTIHAMRRSGLTLKGIAERLNESGSRTRRNAPWYSQAVFELLTRHPDIT